MMKDWWGKLVLLLMAGVFFFGIWTSYKGDFIPPLYPQGKDMHIRKDSEHYHSRYHGYYYGGGIRAGK